MEKGLAGMNRQKQSPRRSSLDGKWCLLLTLACVVFVYMVVVTEVMQLTTTPQALVDAKQHERSLGFDISSTGMTLSDKRDAVPQETPRLDVDDSYDDADKEKSQSRFVQAGSNHVTETSMVEEKHLPRRKQNKNRRKKKKEQQPVNASEVDWSKWSFAEPAPQPNISNMEFYNITSDGENNLWDNDPTLPYWMRSYFNWHKWKRKTWDLENWETERWMIAQCLMDQDKRKCGGTSDRLKPIPTLLRIAYDTKRILLIRWTRPSMLEDFLMPPEGGFDWRVPPGLLHVVHNDTHGKKLTPFKMIQRYTVGGMSVVRTKYQTNNPENTYALLTAQDQNATLSDYELRQQVEMQNQPSFDQVFHSVWRIFFTPSPPVAARIRSKLHRLGLTPNHYVAAHLRALYGVDDRDDAHIQVFTENALACATQLRPGVPIFFASDSSVASEHALMIGKEKKIPNQGEDHRPEYDDKLVKAALEKGVVISIPDPNPPWHLDTMIGPVEKFYDTFVDLYLMSLAGCVTHGIGGYGHWALLIGGDINCTLRQEHMGRRPYVREKCPFRAPDEETKRAEDGLLSNKTASAKTLESLFLQPMKDSVGGYGARKTS
jgi:hypothetical protein